MALLKLFYFLRSVYSYVVYIQNIYTTRNEIFRENIAQNMEYKGDDLKKNMFSLADCNLTKE